MSQSKELVLKIANDFESKFNKIPSSISFTHVKWLFDSVDKYLPLRLAKQEEEITLKTMDYLEEERGFNLKV